jgi:hypothetical protein
MFLKSIDAPSHVKDANLIISLLAEVVEEIGVKHVAAILVDNIANYLVAGKLLCAKYRMIFWAWCATHCIDLILKDIVKLERV